MKYSHVAVLLISIFLSSCVPSHVLGEITKPGLTVIDTVLVDNNATVYGTFQSHNQKVVSNGNGIFMTYIRTRNEAYTAQQWRLLRSTDGGTSFSIVYEATDATNPPVLETDELDNIYLVRPDFLDGNAYLYRFLAADGYAKPLISKIEKGSHGKYAMLYDRERRQLYYFSANNMFFVIGLDGEVRKSLKLLQDGESAGLQYPLLSLGRDGTLHAAWTTQKHGVYLYWDIHHMLSRDGGETWHRINGTPIALPAVADQHGPTDRITLDDEYEAHTWLSSFMAKDGKLHFVYLAQTQPPRQHYLRYDLKTAKKDVDIWPTFKGEKISLRNLDGFFASRTSIPNSTLYYIMAEEEGYVGFRRLACLASDDNGETWYDYAVSEMYFNPYSIGGCRELTSDGYIIGSFTYQKDPPSVYFFKIQAGLSGAKVVSARYTHGSVTLMFTDIRGQPSEVRFRFADGQWSKWQPFERNLTSTMKDRPIQFQLKSRLGVVSKEYDILEDVWSSPLHEWMFLPPNPVVLGEPSDITDNSMKLTWTENTEADFKNYNIYLSDTQEIIGTLIHTIMDKSTTSYMVTHLSPNTKYYFTVRVYDSSGLYADSNPVSGKTKATPPTFPWEFVTIIIIVLAIAAPLTWIMKKRALR